VRQESGLTDRIFRPKGEFESVGLVLVERVVVKDLNVHLPFFEIVVFDY
jgi:hypothetical protein